MPRKKPADIFPPSQMFRYLACPGAYALERTQPKRETVSTEEGHAAHTLAQMALTDGRFDAHAYAGQEIKTATVPYVATPEMCDAVQRYVDAVRAAVEKLEADPRVARVRLMVEQRLDTSSLMGIAGQYGTADALIIADCHDGSSRLSVEDLKYGKYVKVDAENNTQLMIYAAAAIENFCAGRRVEDITLVIHAPRQNETGRWSPSRETLDAFAATLPGAVRTSKAQEKKLKEEGIGALALSTGKHCGFCKAKKLCPAFAAAAAARPHASPQKPKNKPRPK